MVSQESVSAILAKWSGLSDATRERVARLVASDYGRAYAEHKRTEGKISGSVKNAQATIKDTSGVIVRAAPHNRFFIACCKLRDEVEKLASRKGQYGFDCAEMPKLVCPGLEAALGKEESVPVESASVPA